MKYKKERIYEILEDVLQMDETQLKKISVKEDLKDYGLDSIHAIQLIVFLEDEYGIEFDDEDLLFDNYDTLEKLMNLLEKY